MIPASTLSNSEITYKKKASKTYKIAENNMLKGTLDGIEAVKQAVDLILSTERYVYPIYSWNYGVELESLVGEEYGYVYPEVKRRIKEALTQDERVREVINFKIDKLGDEVTIQFEVVTLFGNFTTERKVNI